MRFLVQPTPDALARARPPVRAFLAFAALALGGLALQRALAGGLTPAGVLEAYLPGASRCRRPRSGRRSTPARSCTASCS